MQNQAEFIVHGVHITENLAHHKVSDVRRILEEKGFKERAGDTEGEGCHFYPESGSADEGKQTTIRFDDGGFVAEEGVRHEG